MARPVTLFSGQWADLPIDTICQKTKDFGCDGIELGCWGDHMEIDKADQAYCDQHQRHKAILPSYIWGDGDPEGIRQRAARI